MSIDRWMDKMMWYISTVEYHSVIKNNEIMPFAVTWMQPEIIILSDVSILFTYRKVKYLFHQYVESKIWHKWTYLWNRLTDIGNRWWLPRGVGKGGMEGEVMVSRFKLLYMEWINNKVILHSTENYIQYPMLNHNGK